jgi:hypothetical protein
MWPDTSWKTMFKYAYELIIYIELCECLTWFRRLKPNCAYFTYLDNIFFWNSLDIINQNWRIWGNVLFCPVFSAVFDNTYYVVEEISDLSRCIHKSGKVLTDDVPKASVFN